MKSNKNNRMDAMGDRMKAYERIETEQRFKPNQFLHVRLDGRGFSKFTKGLQRPFDTRLSQLMIDTTVHLVGAYRATIGYTQSDEISLLISNSYETPCDFDGKKQKLLSSLAASCTSFFVKGLAKAIPEKFELENVFPTFDCRIFECPSDLEASNSLLWREFDARKNSISMLAQHHFKHSELQGKRGDEMIDMLKTMKNVIWEDQPQFFTHGTYVKRVPYELWSEITSEPVKRNKISKIQHTLSMCNLKQRIHLATTKDYDYNEVCSITD